MKLRTIFTIICLMGFLVACQTTPPIQVDPCPMPTGYKIGPAIESAEQTLNICPTKLDQVFATLLDISKHQPNKENGDQIKLLLIRLSKGNLISERYAKSLYNQYFNIKFESLPDVKIYNLPAEIDNIKKQLRAELAMKKTGLVDCCGDKEGYALAENEYSRVVNLMENLVLNHQYVSGGSSNW
jgi:hypothetical protein